MADTHGFNKALSYLKQVSNHDQAIIDSFQLVVRYAAGEKTLDPLAIEIQESDMPTEYEAISNLLGSCIETKKQAMQQRLADIKAQMDAEVIAELA